MKLIQRESYMEKMISVIGTPDIKVDYSGAPEPVNPIFRATLSAWQSHSE